jgi:predicted ATP-dependent protease
LTVFSPPIAHSALPPSLPPAALRTVCDPAALPFDTTADLGDGDEPLGQERAVEAIRFAIGMRHRGFNLFALGPEGTGRRSLVTRYLRQAAADAPPPADWVYVNNFADPHKPLALTLPSGRAPALRQDMAELVEELGVAIPAAFEAEEYRNRRRVLEDSLKERQEAALGEVQHRAADKNLALVRTPVGLALAPTKAGEVLSPDEFHQMPEAEQERVKAEMTVLQERLEEVMKQFPRWDRETRAQVRALDREVVAGAVSHLMEDIRARYVDLPEVLAYLDSVARSVADNVGDFVEEGEEGGGRGAKARREGGMDGGGLRRYRVNVLVTTGASAGAPVVYEDHPTQPNLSGRVEHIAQFGALLTDFNLIKPGALHEANGGALVLDARKLLQQPFAWEGLKRALKAREIRLESPAQALGLMSTVTLEPQPIPLDVKVVLIGDPMLYYLLSHYDPEFNELFKVAADFDWRVDRTPETQLALARSVAALARKEGLRPLDRGAVARVVERSSRDVEDGGKLSTHMASLADLVREADYWAGRDGAAVVGAGHVDRAVAAAIYRQDRVRANVQEEIRRGTVRIATEGGAVGQINGLAVLQLGRFSFGRPSRITARVRFGKGEVVDIEREVQLGGPLHGKGVLILSSFLSARFGARGPLSLSASLVFEQSYGGIDGDSASSTELYCLLSALADVPVNQGMAVTGSVDQYGGVQAIGGVNDKIEGFFDLCQARGLTGGQGVLIPAANVRHLMLRQDVIDACAQGLFHVWPIETIDQGIALLTGLPAGERDAGGEFPPGSVNRKVEARLAAFARHDAHGAQSRPSVRRHRGGAGMGEEER